MILFAGFVVVGAGAVVEVALSAAVLGPCAAVVPLILVVTLVPLRPLKGLLIALQYHHKAAEGRLERSAATQREPATRRAPAHACRLVVALRRPALAC